MKKLRNVLFTIITAVLVFATVGFTVACNDKEETPPEPEPKTVTVTFMNATALHGTPITGESGTPFTAPADPTRIGFAFDGWSLTEGGAVVALPTVFPEESVTYYAVFSQRYNIMLDAGSNGTLAQESRIIEAKRGDNVYSKIFDIKPTPKGDARFDGWYYNNTKLTDNSELTVGSNITVKAEYVVDYTLNVCLQTEYGRDDYDADDTLSAQCSGTARVGSYIATEDIVRIITASKPEYRVGSKKDDIVISDTPLSVNKADNAFTLYFDICDYTVMFDAALDGVKVSGSMPAEQFGHNVEYSIPKCGFSAAGYMFLGWKTSAEENAPIVYRRNSTEKIKTMSAMTLYAAWAKGLTDINRDSDDYIYITQNDAGTATVAYLERSGLEEKVGTYNSATGEFEFKTGEKTELYGIANIQAGTFMYIDKNVTEYKLNVRTGVVKTTESGIDYIDIENSVDENVTLALNADGSAVYKTAANADPVNGRYEFDADARAMKFTSESVTFRFRLAERNTQAGAISVFEKRDDNVYGTWSGITYSYSDVEGYGITADAAHFIVFDGYGGVTMAAYGYSTLARSNGGYSVASGYYIVKSDNDGRIDVQVSLFRNGYVRTSEFALIDGEENFGTNETPVTKVYVEKSGETVLPILPETEPGSDYTVADYEAYRDAAPAKITLDGCGIFNDSAVYTYTDGGTTKTVKGRYIRNDYMGELTIIPYDETTQKYGAKLMFYIMSAQANGDKLTNEDGSDKTDEDGNVMYEQVNVPFYDIAVSFSQKYSFISGSSVIGSVRLCLFGEDRAGFAFPMIVQESFFGIYSYRIETALYFDGRLTATGEKEPNDDRDIYEFTSNAPFTAELIGTVRLMTYYGAGRAVDISSFENFRYYAGSFGLQSGGSVLGFVMTAVYDEYAGKEITHDGVVYTLDGWGNAVAKDNAENVKQYTVRVSGGMPVLVLAWKDGDNTVTQIYYIISENNEIKFLKTDKEYTVNNSAYSFVFITLENDYALVGYLYITSSSITINFVSVGKVETVGGDVKKYREIYATSYETPLLSIYGDFEFTIVAEPGNDDKGNPTAGKIALYKNYGETNVVTVDGVGTLEIDSAEATAKFTDAKDNNKEYNGAYKLRGDILSITYTENENTLVKAFALTKNELEVVTSFTEVSVEAGTWWGQDGITNVELSGVFDGEREIVTGYETNEDGTYKTDGNGNRIPITKTVKTARGVYNRYDSETEKSTAFEIEYYLTGNAVTVGGQQIASATEIAFFYSEDVGGEQTELSMRIALATSVAQTPLFLVYKMPLNHGVYETPYADNQIAGLIGGGYDSQYIVAGQSRLEGELVVYQNGVWQFAVDESSTIFYFRQVGTKLVLLDATVNAPNFGSYYIADGSALTVHGLSGMVSGIKRLVFTGYGIVYFIPADADKEDGTVDMDLVVTGGYTVMSGGSILLYTVVDEKIIYEARCIVGSVTGENETVRYVAIISDKSIDSAFGNVFTGDGYAVLRFSGMINGTYGSASYIDKNGVSRSVRYRYASETVIEISYSDEIFGSTVIYVTLDKTNKTFTFVDAPAQGGDQTENGENERENAALAA